MFNILKLKKKKTIIKCPNCRSKNLYHFNLELEGMGLQNINVCHCNSCGCKFDEP